MCTHLGDAVAFFLYDVPKVLLLLLGIVTVVSFLRSYFPPERMRAALAGHGTLPATVGAAGFGVVTPFCSCSAVPLFIGFVEAGIPMGVTFAFLISSPMVNEVALVLLWGLFGPGIALLYMAAGLTVAIDQDLASVRTQEPRAHPQRGGLARAVGSQEAENLSGTHLETQPIHGRDAAVTAREIANLER